MTHGAAEWTSDFNSPKISATEHMFKKAITKFTSVQTACFPQPLDIGIILEDTNKKASAVCNILCLFSLFNGLDLIAYYTLRDNLHFFFLATHNMFVFHIKSFTKKAFHLSSRISFDVSTNK